MPELFFAFLALLCWGFKDVFNKRILEKIDVYSLLLVEYFPAVMLIGAALLFFSQPVFPQGNTLLLVVFTSILGATSVIAYFKAIQKSKVGLIYAIGCSFPLFSVFFATVFLGESFQVSYAIALPLILASLFLLAYRNQGLSFDEGFWFAAYASVSWGVYFTIAKIISAKLNAFNASFFMEAGVLVVLAVFFMAKRKKLAVPKSFEEKKLVVLYVFLFAAGVIFGNLSLLAVGVSLTSLVTATAPALNALAAWVFLKEKLSRNQYVGIALLIASLILLSF